MSLLIHANTEDFLKGVNMSAFSDVHFMINPVSGDSCSVNNGLLFFVLVLITNIVSIQSISQGYTTYGSHMGMQQHPSQGGGIVSSSYGNPNFQGTHPGANPGVVDPLRQMQQRPSGYIHQQASSYAHNMQNTQRSAKCSNKICCFVLCLVALKSRLYSVCCF